jgi:predicted RNA-binding Zn-ribbon protein involved in translation (DUF1610 family)
MEEQKSLQNNEVFCGKCGALLELEPREIESGKFVCPECGEENKLTGNENPEEKEKSLLINDSYAECISCGSPKELSEKEILSRSYDCPECGIANVLEVKPDFHAYLENENTVKCENCGTELELEPEEIIAGIFFCSECERINSILERKNYARLRENNETACVNCERKIILEKEEIQKKTFFCPRCGVENYLG